MSIRACMIINKAPGMRPSPVETLSNRELQVLELIGRGMSTHQIARMLALNVKTIGTYREKIKMKLHLKSAAELTRYAIHWVEGGRNAAR